MADAMLDATKDAPLIITADKFTELMLTMYVRGVADGRKSNAS